MKKIKPLSWKPRRRGLVYCAPACGHNCTWAAYLLAVQGAKRLAARLNKVGEGWVPRVWENGGWHFAARSGTVEVFQGTHCLIADRLGGGGGSCLWTTLKYDPTVTTPEAALKREFESMLQCLGEILAAARSAGRAAGREVDVTALLRAKQLSTLSIPSDVDLP